MAYAREFLAGLRASKVLGCGKHFPGLGEGKLDSHHKLPIIQKPLKKLWAEDLFPYRALRAQLPMVMVSHAAYPAVTRNQTPASLSKTWITDILRKRIGYRNLIVSDDLEMGAVLSAASVGEAAVEHIRAGGDLCLICHREDYITTSLRRAYQSDRARTPVREARSGLSKANSGPQEKVRKLIPRYETSLGREGREAFSKALGVRRASAPARSDAS